ncbi:MAG: PH domain-containing protein [Paenisporosarcina sp.]
MSEERYKLHPISAVMNFVKGLKDFIFPIVVVFVANRFQGDSGGDSEWTRFIPYFIGFIFLVLMLISGIIKWKRFVYWFEDNELRIEYGLFVKKKRYIPFERIQSLNYTESILHRPLKLVKVKIETAGSGNSEEAEAELTAISKVAASRIEKELAEAKKRKQSIAVLAEHDEKNLIQEETVFNTVPIFKMTLKDILLLATTSGGIGVVFSGLAVFMSQFSELIPYERIYEEMMVFLKFGFFLVTISIFFVLLLAWVISVILTTLNYFEFTIWKEHDQIILTRGLLEKKKVSIPIARVQGIRIVENPLRQLFGYCTVFVESAGGSLSEKDQKIRLFPFIKKKNLKQHLEKLFPNLQVELNWIVSPKRARPFYYRIDFLWTIPVIIGVGYFYYPYGILSFLLIPILIVFGLWQHRSAGYSITDYYLSMRYRGFSKYTFMIEKKRMQAVEMKQSPFQKKHSLASFETTIKSGLLGATAKVEHLELKDVEYLMNWFTPSNKK